MAPVFVIGMLKDIDETNPPKIDDFDIQRDRVLLPGLLIIIFVYVVTMIFRTALGQDMIEEKSANVHVGSSQTDVLTNTGLVCALFLTIVIAMVQVDPPIQSHPGRMICQYYQLFNIMALFLCFLGSMLSSMLLQYITPLDEDASFVYFKNFIDYFGEPACCILTALLMFIYATTCWIFGAYGRALGIICVIAMDLCLQRIILTQMYISKWRNPFISDSHRNMNMSTATGSAAVGSKVKQ